MPKFYNIEAGENSAKIYLHSQIGENWFGEGMSSQGFIDEVDALGEIANIDLHINSPGGNVNDGVAIYNHLKQHKATVKVTVDGVAASIASVIAMAGDEIIMPLGSTMFVHDPLTWVVGNADVMREMAGHLDKIKDSIIDIYVNRTGLSREDVSDLMTGETTMTAKEAVDWGFATATESYDKPIMNTFNADEMKHQVQMSGELMMKGKEVSNLKEQLETAKQEITDLKSKVPSQPEPAVADAVIAQCREAGFDSLAIGFIENKMTTDAIANALTVAGEVRDICAAVGIESGAVLAQIQSPVNMLRNALNEMAALHGDDISNRISPEALASGAGKLTSVVDIYKKRNKQLQ